MPITVQHGPIGAALQLAAQAGEGQGRLQREQLAQQVLGRLDQQARTAIAARSQQASEALAYDRLRAQQRQAEEDRATRQATSAAQLALEGRQQNLLEQRAQQQQAQLAEEQQRAAEFRQQFQQQRGMAPELWPSHVEGKRIELAERQEQRLGQQTRGLDLPDATLQMQREYRQMEKEVDAAVDAFNQYAKPRPQIQGMTEIPVSQWRLRDDLTDQERAEAEQLRKSILQGGNILKDPEEWSGRLRQLQGAGRQADAAQMPTPRQTQAIQQLEMLAPGKPIAEAIRSGKSLNEIEIPDGLSREAEVHMLNLARQAMGLEPLPQPSPEDEGRAEGLRQKVRDAFAPQVAINSVATGGVGG